MTARGFTRWRHRIDRSPRWAARDAIYVNTRAQGVGGLGGGGLIDVSDHAGPECQDTVRASVPRGSQLRAG